MSKFRTQFGQLTCYFNRFLLTKYWNGKNNCFKDSDFDQSILEMNTPKERINQILAVLTERSVDCRHCIKFRKQYCKTINEHGLQVHYHKGTKGLVIQTFDKRLLFSENDKIYELDVVPAHGVIIS